MTLRNWRKPWFEVVKKFVSSFSLVFLISAFCLAEPDYAQIDRQLKTARNTSAKRAILRKLHESNEADNDLQEQLSQLVDSWDSGYEWSESQVANMISLRARLAKQSSAKSAKPPAEMARTIKSNPLYRDPGAQESSNWVSRAMTRLGELIQNIIKSLIGDGPRTPDAPDLSAFGRFMQAVGPLLKLFVFFVLACLLALFLYLVVKHFRWRAKLLRTATALLEEDEPERARDEWLELANKLASEGKYREAVRCLYLATLLRFDEAGVARFIRTETNWEHLKRIESSSLNPPSLDFREPTLAFDRVWYGFKVKGISDVEYFRDWYSKVSAAFSAFGGTS